MPRLHTSLLGALDDSLTLWLTKLGWLHTGTTMAEYGEWGPEHIDACHHLALTLEKMRSCGGGQRLLAQRTRFRFAAAAWPPNFVA